MWGEITGTRRYFSPQPTVDDGDPQSNGRIIPLSVENAQYSGIALSLNVEN
jgi:hypothetical protein